jgi:BirA family biotin operon repressor/biotin-[acetyl-CoA-carboxylase] ligase
MAKVMLRNDDKEEWDVIVADHQTNGRGQRENVWISSAGQNLTMSLILRSSSLNRHTPWAISMATALSIRDLMAQETARECFVKWPNDIILQDKKIAGVLMENIWSGESIKYSIIGIGINLRQRDFGNVKTAISLCEFVEDIRDVKFYCEQLFRTLYNYLQGQNMSIIDNYNRYLYRVHETSCVDFNGIKLPDEIIGVNEDGLLITRDENGKESLRNHPEARVLYRNP